MKKLIRCEIRWDRQNRCWAYWQDKNILVYCAKGETKREFIKRLAEYLKRRLDLYYAFSLRIFNRNGRIAEERTYPRAADPRRSKG